MIHIDNEYILTVKTIPSKTYRVYAPNKKVATNRFISLCDMYMKTDNKDNKLHWQNLKKTILDEKFTIFKSEDYYFVREIL